MSRLSEDADSRPAHFFLAPANQQGHKKITPFFIPYAITNMGGALLAIELGFMARNT